MIAQLVALDLFCFVLPYCSEMIEIWLHPLCCLKISGLREAGSLHPGSVELKLLLVPTGCFPGVRALSEHILHFTPCCTGAGVIFLYGLNGRDLLECQEQ